VRGKARDGSRSVGHHLPLVTAVLDRALAQRLADRAHPPRAASSWAVPAGAVALFAAVIGSEPYYACTPQDPCAADPVGAIALGLLLATVVTSWLAPAVAAVAASLLAVLTLWDEARRPWFPGWVEALFVGLALLAMWVALERRHARRAVAGLLEDAPRTTLPEDAWARSGARLWLLAGAGLVAVAVAASAWSWTTQQRESAAEAAAPVLDGQVVAHDEEGFVLTVEPSGAVARDGGTTDTIEVEVLEAVDYPVGTTHPFWLMGPDDLRPVAEPYDASLGYLLAVSALAGAAAVAVRARARASGLEALRSVPQPLLRARGRRFPGVVVVYPVDAVDGEKAALVVPVALAVAAGDDEWDTWDEVVDLPGVEELELVGTPAPGHWCAVRVDGVTLEPVGTCVRDAEAPAAGEDDDIDLVAFDADDLSPLDLSGATAGVHRSPGLVQAASVGAALVVTAVGVPVADWLTGWAHVPSLAVSALAGLAALEWSWRTRLRPELRWDAGGVAWTGWSGPPRRATWSQVEGVVAVSDGVQLVLSDDEHNRDEDEDGAELWGAATAPRRLPRAVRAGWRSAPELRAALLRARAAAVPGLAPAEPPPPRRPAAVWALWLLVVAAVAVLL
jgi:hypothetical protein